MAKISFKVYLFYYFFIIFENIQNFTKRKNGMQLFIRTTYVFKIFLKYILLFQVKSVKYFFRT